MYDDIILDLGASIEKRVMDFALSSHQVIIITTPQDVISGYGCLKATFIRFIQLASRAKGLRPELKVFRPLIVVNQARTKNQGLVVFNAMSNLIRESLHEILFYLGQPEGIFKVEPRYLGEIPYVRDTLIRAEMARQPVIEMFPRSGATLAFKSLANLLIKGHDGVAPAKLKPDFLEQWMDEEGEELGISKDILKTGKPH
jgi:MinD-like ATPase involved in chromosome partitioning or flagellar assembly